MQISDVERSGLKWGDGLCRNHLFLLQSFFFRDFVLFMGFFLSKGNNGRVVCLKSFFADLTTNKP